MKQTANGYPRICYEIFIRSFCDSNGDGIGDLNGITSKLPYLQALGTEAIWLTPFHPSPSYHKYDVTDYYAVDPEYGTLEDFRELLRAARELNIAVYMDFVMSHTSTDHLWFREARKGADNPFRDFYIWLPPGTIAEKGIGVRASTDDSDAVRPWHVNTGDPEMYYGLFSSTMADLNYDHGEVKAEMFRIARFWLEDVGVDGFRLDAARHIYPHWLPEKNIAFWNEYREQIGRIREGVFSVGEIWTGSAEIAPYLGGLPATFNFELSNAIQQIIRSGEDTGLVGMLNGIYATYAAQRPDFIDATMLTNHDQTRIGSVAEGDVRKMKLAASLLLTLPGQPYLYYGEEIGMLGQKPDPYIREPFLWSHVSNDPEVTQWIIPRYSKLRLIRPLSLKLPDPASLVNHYRRLIRLRKSEPALGDITSYALQAVDLGDRGVIAFTRKSGERTVLVLHNLSPKTRQLAREGPLHGYDNVLFATGQALWTEGGELVLRPYESVVLSPY